MKTEQEIIDNSVHFATSTSLKNSFHAKISATPIYQCLYGDQVATTDKIVILILTKEEDKLIGENLVVKSISNDVFIFIVHEIMPFMLIFRITREMMNIG